MFVNQNAAFTDGLTGLAWAVYQKEERGKEKELKGD